jgi:hypothetical protein
MEMHFAGTRRPAGVSDVWRSQRSGRGDRADRAQRHHFPEALNE